jgi:hypothetical protein
VPVPVPGPTATVTTTNDDNTIIAGATLGAALVVTAIIGFLWAHARIQ